MKPQFANMTLEEFMKEMEPYRSPDRFSHLSSEQLRERAAEFRLAANELHKINKKLKEGIEKRDTDHG